MGSIKAGGFTCLYTIEDDNAVITGVEGMDSSLIIPGTVIERDKEYVVSQIGKKALLGVNGLRHIYVPASVQNIGDWAFSHCIHLVSLVIMGRDVIFGRGMLEGCQRLKTVSIGYDKPDDLSFLLAAVVNKLSATYLFNGDNAGSESWYRTFDSTLSQYLNESDYAGASENALCGEEDISYDDIKSVDGELLGADASYIIGVRKNKNYLCLLRLRYNNNLTSEFREFLEDYVRRHSAGHKNNAAWATIREDLYEDNEYLMLYLDITKPSADDIELMLADLAGEHPQMKAQLLNYKAEQGFSSDFFDDLLL